MLVLKKFLDLACSRVQRSCENGNPIFGKNGLIASVSNRLLHASIQGII